jgi:uncharacterized Zn-finger protein
MPADAPAPPEIIEVEQTTVACDGGGGALGHPLVYLNMGDKDEIVCPYCSRQFVFEAGTAAVAGH